jgi:hypothetical protein
MLLSSLYYLDVYGCHTANSKPVKQEVNGTVIHPSLVFPGGSLSAAVLTKLLTFVIYNSA